MFVQEVKHTKEHAMTTILYTEDQSVSFKEF